MPGIFSSTTALRIFHVAGSLGDYEQALEDAAFTAQPQDPGPDERIIGFVGLGNALDTDFAFSPSQGQFIALSLRVDERKPSQAAIKMRLAQAIKQEEEAHNGKISRQRKKELKEEISARVKAQSDLVPTLLDLIWDTERSLLFCTSTVDSLVELACELFARVFQVETHPLAACADLAKRFESIYAGDRPMRLQLSDTQRALLGSYDYRVTLSTPENAEEKATVSARGSQEPGLKALEEGLQIKRLGILAQIYEANTPDDQEPDRECVFLLDDELNITQLKMPKLEDTRDRRDREDRLYLNADHAATVAEIVMALCATDAP